MIEVVGHDLYPELDPLLDSLVTSPDRKSLTFRSMLEKRWEGVEIRMASRQAASIDLVIRSADRLRTLVGQRSVQPTFPIKLDPEDAEVGRQDLHNLFRQDDIDLAIFWVDPGSQPIARDEKQEELRRKLKAIGYIE